MQRPHLTRTLLLLLSWTILLAGCAAQVPAGRWETDPRVQKSFEAGTLLPNHTYYYLGSYTAPDSVIAIDNRFTLRTRVWAQVDISEQMLNGWLNWYRTENFGWSCPYQGGVILTPDGQQAGIWYSRNIINIIRMPEPGVLEVYQPVTITGRRCEERRDND
ncbi:MAG: hypothetical protein JZU50_15410 [Desulfobulbaceae bacterium]|jgi:hypothetical protein|nr:hypothetical protein [Desulfobulbaceae bacterium]